MYFFAFPSKFDITHPLNNNGPITTIEIRPEHLQMRHQINQRFQVTLAVNMTVPLKDFVLLWPGDTCGRLRPPALVGPAAKVVPVADPALSGGAVETWHPGTELYWLELEICRFV